MYDDGLVDGLPEEFWQDPVCSDVRSSLPDMMELQPPGPELAVMLAAVDRGVLTDPELVVVAQARARQLNHLQASLMADLVAIAGRCDPRLSYPPNGADPIDHAEVEIAAAMTWTASATSKQVEFAERLVRDLPEVH